MGWRGIKSLDLIGKRYDIPSVNNAHVDRKGKEERKRKRRKNMLNRVQKSKGGETYDIFPLCMYIFFPH
jgi:hypothetical protein